MPERIKDGAYITNFDEYADVGTHWIALYCEQNEIIYFDSFRVEHVPKEVEKFIGHKNIKKKHIPKSIKQFNNVWILAKPKLWLILLVCFLLLTLKKMTI